MTLKFILDSCRQPASEPARSRTGAGWRPRRGWTGGGGPAAAGYGWSGPRIERSGAGGHPLVDGVGLAFAGERHVDREERLSWRRRRGALDHVEYGSLGSGVGGIIQRDRDDQAGAAEFDRQPGGGR